MRALLATLEDIAGAAVFLCSDVAWFIIPAAAPVDGGCMVT